MAVLAVSSCFHFFVYSLIFLGGCSCPRPPRLVRLWAYISMLVSNFKNAQIRLLLFHTSAAVAVDSSHINASSSASWSRFSPPSSFVNGHVSTMRFMVCRWLQSQEGDWARPHLCKLARHLDLSGNSSFIETVYDEGDRNLAVG